MVEQEVKEKKQRRGGGNGAEQVEKQSKGHGRVSEEGSELQRATGWKRPYSMPLCMEWFCIKSGCVRMWARVSDIWPTAT